MQKVANLDRKCRRMALDLSDEVNAIAMKASGTGSRESRIRTSSRRRFAVDKVRCATRGPTRRRPGGQREIYPGAGPTH